LGSRGGKWHENGEKCKARSFIIVGRTWGREEKTVIDFVRNMKGKAHLEYQGIDGNSILFKSVPSYYVPSISSVFFCPYH